VATAPDLPSASTIRAQIIAEQMIQTSYVDAEVSARRQFLLGLLLVLVAVAGVIAAAVIGIARSDFNEGRTWLAYLMIMLSLALVVAMSSAIMLQAISSQREISRARRQMLAIEGYVAGLSDDLGAFVKAALAPRVFTERGVEEPWSSPNWPTAAELLSVLQAPTSRQDQGAAS
jgi:hypothetical protein